MLNTIGVTVKKLIQSIPTAYQQNIHAKDPAILIDFLNVNSKIIGAIENLGSFIDITGVTNDVGIVLEAKYLVIEREVRKMESPGDEYEVTSESKKKDIFEYPYNLPDTFPKTLDEDDDNLILSAKTHACEPEMACSECDGTGICAACEGRGSKSCKSCNGTGKKDVSAGTYADGRRKTKKVACTVCDGTKRVTCTSCKRTKKCNQCGGSGEVTCTRCGGTSSYQNISYLWSAIHTITNSNMSSNLKEFIDVVGSTENRVVFDDDLVEWEAANAILFDKRNDAIKLNKHFSEFANSLDADAGLSEGQRLGRVHAKFSNVPITTVDYIFEDKAYTLSIIGENNIVCYEEVPRKHLHRAGIFTRFINLFTQQKRQLAFLYIAAYMLNSDGFMDKRELMLMDMLLKHVMPSQVDRQKFIDEFCRALSFSEIAPFIGCVKNDPRAVVFAWQCVLQDKKVESSELEAFRVLADSCGIDASTMEKLKQKAEKFGNLNDSQLISEYFK